MDVDGTLISGKDPVLSNDIKNWIITSKKYFYTYLFSNNPSRERISRIGKELDLEFTFSGSKPFKTKLKNVLDKIPYSSNEIAIIGDRVFTDILVGNRLGMYTILIDSIDHDGKRIEKNKFQSLERYIAKIISGNFL